MLARAAWARAPTWRPAAYGKRVLAIRDFIEIDRPSSYRTDRRNGDGKAVATMMA
jgi:hypothetical protein